ncbi:hypothetical protein BDR26DRAFT_204295 [Obelidium mucronatum]|nr:hypothetical protein BDR26DRAFT_204295 [Obelidium mucronatum]
MFLVTLPANTTPVGFKAQPSSSPINRSSSDPPSDWAAVYPQLTVEMALAYLPNQWDRGHQEATIVSLQTLKPITIVVIPDPVLADGAASSADKAAHIRKVFNESCGSLGLPVIPDNMPLMDAFGSIQLALCIRDADGFELVIPHDLYNESQFVFKPLFTFHQSTICPYTTGKVDGHVFTRTELQSERMMAERLNECVDSHSSPLLPIIHQKLH